MNDTSLISLFGVTMIVYIGNRLSIYFSRVYTSYFIFGNIDVATDDMVKERKRMTKRLDVATKRSSLWGASLSQAAMAFTLTGFIAYIAKLHNETPESDLGSLEEVLAFIPNLWKLINDDFVVFSFLLLFQLLISVTLFTLRNNFTIRLVEKNVFPNMFKTKIFWFITISGLFTLFLSIHYFDKFIS